MQKPGKKLISPLLGICFFAWAALPAQAQSPMAMLQNFLTDIKICRAYYEKNADVEELEKIARQGEQADQKLTWIRNNRLFEADKILAGGVAQELYSYLMHNCWELAQVDSTHAETYYRKAFYYSERNKAMVLLKGLFMANFHTQQMRPELARQFSKVEHALTQNELLALQAGCGECQDSLPLLTEQYESLRQQAPPTQKINIAKLQRVQQALRPAEAMLHFFVSSKAIYRFYIRAHAIDMQRIPVNEDQLGQKIKLMRSGISSMTDFFYKSNAEWLYQLLFRGLTPGSLPGSLLIVADGVLLKLPFGALPTQGQQRPYLIEETAVRYQPSATYWLANPGAGRKIHNEWSFLGFAPAFLHQDMPGRPAIAPLPQSLTELDSIAYALQGKVRHIKILKHKQATEQAFLENAGQYEIIHLSTHGKSQMETSILSEILFFPTQHPPYGVQPDGHLYAAELKLHQWGTKLLVLSACETGAGKLMPGEGMLALNRAFMAAGIKNQLFTLWKIPDAHQLITGFYKAAASGLSFSKALQQAKIQSIKMGQHPFYWAPFLLIGY